MVSEEFKRNVELEDLVTIRSALVDYLIIDRTFKKFDEALSYACERLDLMQPYDNGLMETDAEKWDSEYLNLQKVKLMSNFSEERINHLKKIIETVLPLESVEDVSVPLSGKSDSVSRTHEKRTGRTIVSETVSVTPSKPIREGTQQTSQRMGTRTIKRTTVYRQKSSHIIEKAMVAGGAAIVIAGMVMVKPVIIGTGIVVAGIGIKAQDWR